MSEPLPEHEYWKQRCIIFKDKLIATEHERDKLREALLYYGQTCGNSGDGARTALGMTIEEVHEELRALAGQETKD